VDNQIGIGDILLALGIIGVAFIVVAAIFEIGIRSERE